MAAVWSVSPDSSRPDAQAASSGGIGIGGAALRRAGSRCWMTNVPAKTSPSRLPFADSREQMRAGTPMKGTSQKSTSVARPRTRACRKRSGLPSSPTTRRPSASFPGVLPLVAASQTTG